MLRKLRDRLMQYKIYINRTISYASIINSGMLLFLVLSRLKELGYINVDLQEYFFIILFFGFIILLLIGWLEIKVFKGVQQENRIAFALTPPMVEMKEKIDYIYDKLKSNDKP
jgi:hypothetical protein